MVDMEAIVQSLSEHRTALGKINKQRVFEALAANGFTCVNVTFDGEGDSGQIENLAGYVGDELTKLPEIKLTPQTLNWSGDAISTEEKSLSDAIEQLCYNFLEQDHGGWENNDGAFGEFTLDVNQQTVELEFNGRYSDFHTSTHTF